MSQRDYTVKFSWAYVKPTTAIGGYGCYIFLSHDGVIVYTRDFGNFWDFNYDQVEVTIIADGSSAELRAETLCGYETTTGEFSGAALALDDFSVKDSCTPSTPTPTPTPSPGSTPTPGALCGPQILSNPSFEEENGNDQDGGDWMFSKDFLTIRTNDPTAGENGPRADDGDKYL